jgi:hypothetical protein
MHTFWLRSSPAEDAGIPAKPGSNPVSPSSRSLKSGLALTRIGQVVAITAGKDLTPIKNGNAMPTSVVRTNEPGALTPKMTRRPVQVDRILFAHPVLAIGTAAIAPYDMVREYSHGDASSGFSRAFPTRDNTLVRHQTTVAHWINNRGVFAPNSNYRVLGWPTKSNVGLGATRRSIPLRLVLSAVFCLRPVALHDAVVRYAAYSCPSLGAWRPAAYRRRTTLNIVCHLVLLA